MDSYLRMLKKNSENLCLEYGPEISSDISISAPLSFRMLGLKGLCRERATLPPGHSAVSTRRFWCHDSGEGCYCMYRFVARVLLNTPRQSYPAQNVQGAVAQKP